MSTQKQKLYTPNEAAIAWGIGTRAGAHKIIKRHRVKVVRFGARERFVGIPESEILRVKKIRIEQQGRRIPHYAEVPA